MDYKFFNTTPEVQEAIRINDSLRQKIGARSEAYEAVKRFYATDDTLKQYFVVTPTGRLDDDVAATIRHGFLVTAPNVPDDRLPPEAIAARERAVEIGVQAAQTVLPTQEQGITVGHPPRTHVEQLAAARAVVTPRTAGS